MSTIQEESLVSISWDGQYKEVSTTSLGSHFNKDNLNSIGQLQQPHKSKRDKKGQVNKAANTIWRVNDGVNTYSTLEERNYQEVVRLTRRMLPPSVIYTLIHIRILHCKSERVEDYGEEAVKVEL